MTLMNKKVVLLGGTSGLGLATAIAAAAEAAKIIVVSGNSERVQKALSQLPPGSEGYIADASKEKSLQELFSKMGSFDHLVFTAGESLPFNYLENLSMDDARHYFETRFWGALAAAKYAAPHINERGSITLTNGIVGLRPLKGWSVATCICGAIEALTRALAIELAPIRVNAVCGGVVNTNLWNNMQPDSRDQFFREISAKLPAGRVGEAVDLAKTYLYLMQQEFSTGQCVIVDGGGVLV